MALPGLVLASASPRRRLLLGLLGIPFLTAPTDIPEEPLAGEAALDLPLRLAAEKARASSAPPERAVLAADTVVALDGRVFGKPADGEEAAAMLRALRGRWHEVATGVAVRPAGGIALSTGRVLARVRMRAYTEAEIAASVAGGVPLDKAGAYAIQDEAFRPVEALEGCFLNVVGLPLCEVVRQLRGAGLAVHAAPSGPFPPPCVLCRTGAALPGIGGGGLLAP